MRSSASRIEYNTSRSCPLQEALGLGWDDVDLNAKTLRVRRALQPVDKKLVFVELKSERSRRMVRLPDFAVTALTQQRTAQKGAVEGRREMERLGAGVHLIDWHTAR